MAGQTKIVTDEYCPTQLSLAGEVAPVLSQDTMRKFAWVLMQGWADRANAEKEFTGTKPTKAKTEEHFYKNYVVEQADELAFMMTLMGQWTDDLLSLFGTSKHIRLTMELADLETHPDNSDFIVGGTYVVVNVPDHPLRHEPEEWYWSPGAYRWEGSIMDMVWVAGRWKFMNEYLEEEVVA